MGNNFGALASVLSGVTIGKGDYDPNDKRRLKQKRYTELMRGINITSYSTNNRSLSCERKFALNKLELARNKDLDLHFNDNNIHFAYGRAFETMVQSTFLGREKHQVWFDMFCAWDLPLDAISPKADKGDKKSFMEVCFILNKFWWVKEHLFAGWELAYFNEKPAIELSFIIDMGNGYYYSGHVDIILYNPLERRYRVLEIKTTNSKFLTEAMYKNSDQAQGYSIILDSIASDLEETATFEVFYLVNQVPTEELKRYEFTYSRSQRANWVNTILYDTQCTELSRKTGIWPKRGGSCVEFGRTCNYYDNCDLEFEHFNENGFDVVSKEEIENQVFDFRFTLKDIINTQKELI